MLITYPYRNNLSAYVAGFDDVEGSGRRDSLTSVLVEGLGA